MEDANNRSVMLLAAIAAVVVAIFVGVMIVISTYGGSLFSKTCREEGCEETDIYEDGYCKYHYYKSIGQNVLENELGIDKEMQDDFIDAVDGNEKLEEYLKDVVNAGESK